MNVPLRFIDTGYWLALVDRDDAHHARALVLSRTLRGPFLTTQAILTELSNALSRLRWRDRAAALLADILATEAIEVMPVTDDLFRRAVELFTVRRDKEWGLTDCISFVVMQKRGIAEALAADRHLERAGFRALLRES